MTREKIIPPLSWKQLYDAIKELRKAQTEVKDGKIVWTAGTKQNG